MAGHPVPIEGAGPISSTDGSLDSPVDDSADGGLGLFAPDELPGHLDGMAGAISSTDDSLDSPVAVDDSADGGLGLFVDPTRFSDNDELPGHLDGMAGGTAEGAGAISSTDGSLDRIVGESADGGLGRFDDYVSFRSRDDALQTGMASDGKASDGDYRGEGGLAGNGGEAVNGPDEISLNINLGKQYQADPAVLRAVEGLLRMYTSLEGSAKKSFLHCRVFKNPPGHTSPFVQHLKEEAGGKDPPSFAMREAVCIVDKENGEDTSKTHGSQSKHGLVFAGKEGRKLHASTQDKKYYLARRGQVRGQVVKAWKYEMVKEKQDDTSVYVCLFVPYSSEEEEAGAANVESQGGTELPARGAPPARGAQVRNARAAQKDVPPRLKEACQDLVQRAVQEARDQGKLTDGDHQQKQYEKSLNQALLKILERFVGDKASPRWADEVFTARYVRLEWKEVLEHIDEYGKLPWIRSEKEVQKSGIQEDDVVSILEAVENLFLYFRDYIQDSSPQDPPHFVGMTEQQFRDRKIETLERLMNYSERSWLAFRPRPIRAPLTPRNDPALAKIQEILGPSCSDQDLANLAKILARERARTDLPPRQLREAAIEAATEAVRRVQARETSRDACGKRKTQRRWRYMRLSVGSRIGCMKLDAARFQVQYKLSGTSARSLEVDGLVLEVI